MKLKGHSPNFVILQMLTAPIRQSGQLSKPGKFPEKASPVMEKKEYQWRNKLEMEPQFWSFHQLTWVSRKDTILQASTPLMHWKWRKDWLPPLITLLQFNIFLFWNKLSKKKARTWIWLSSPKQDFLQTFTSTFNRVTQQKRKKHASHETSRIHSFLSNTSSIYYLKTQWIQNENNGLLGFFKGFIQLHISGEKLHLLFTHVSFWESSIIFHF